MRRKRQRGGGRRDREKEGERQRGGGKETLFRGRKLLNGY